jgi:hypothetical protein
MLALMMRLRNVASVVFECPFHGRRAGRCPLHSILRSNALHDVGGIADHSMQSLPDKKKAGNTWFVRVWIGRILGSCRAAGYAYTPAARRADPGLRISASYPISVSMPLTERFA